MGQPLSMDLRSRLLAAVDAGMSCRSAAARFGVAPSTAIRWQAQRRATGTLHPGRKAGIRARAVSRKTGRRSWRCGKHAGTSRSMSFVWNWPAST